jgi:hypothetical protein
MSDMDIYTLLPCFEECWAPSFVLRGTSVLGLKVGLVHSASRPVGVGYLEGGLEGGGSLLRLDRDVML